MTMYAIVGYMLGVGLKKSFLVTTMERLDPKPALNPQYNVSSHNPLGYYLGAVIGVACAVLWLYESSISISMSLGYGQYAHGPEFLVGVICLMGGGIGVLVPGSSTSRIATLAHQCVPIFFTWARTLFSITLFAFAVQYLLPLPDFPLYLWKLSNCISAAICTYVLVSQNQDRAKKLLKSALLFGGIPTLFVLTYWAQYYLGLHILEALVATACIWGIWRELCVKAPVIGKIDVAAIAVCVVGLLFTIGRHYKDGNITKEHIVEKFDTIISQTMSEKELSNHPIKKFAMGLE